MTDFLHMHYYLLVTRKGGHFFFSYGVNRLHVRIFTDLLSPLSKHDLIPAGWIGDFKYTCSTWEGESSELSKCVALICICIISTKRNKVIFYQTFYLRKKSLLYNTALNWYLRLSQNYLFIYWFIRYAWIFLRRIFPDVNVYIFAH